MIVPKTAARTMHIYVQIRDNNHDIDCVEENTNYYMRIVTIKKTIEPVARNRTALDHMGKYGSLSLVTGFIRNVLTDASNSGLGSSS